MLYCYLYYAIRYCTILYRNYHDYTIGYHTILEYTILFTYFTSLYGHPDPLGCNPWHRGRRSRRRSFSRAPTAVGPPITSQKLWLPVPFWVQGNSVFWSLYWGPSICGDYRFSHHRMSVWRSSLVSGIEGWSSSVIGVRGRSSQVMKVRSRSLSIILA